MQEERKKILTKIPLIDKQHEAYFQLIDEFESTTSETGKVTHAALEELLNNLLEYSSEHFAAEEFLMNSADYPDSLEHEAAHRDITDSLEELLAKIHTLVSEKENWHSLASFASGLMESQVKIHDLKLAAYLKKNGYHS